ncbi:MAG: hypothetical protein ACI8RZ_002204 [Myxococcota bacterium]|jgi:hypothetical protein
MPRLLPVLLLTLGCRGKDKPVLIDSPNDSGADTSSGDDTSGGSDTVGASGALWQRSEQATTGSVTFSELLYHPPSDTDLEWIELYNPMALDMDLSGWSLEGGVTFTFTEGTVVAAGEYIVVAADPELLESETGFGDALGPYDGQLSNGGERIGLRSNGGRLIDTVSYGDDDPWPVAADGSGLSLAKFAPAAASDHAENWTVSAELGGTPGASNQLDPMMLPTVQVLVAQDATWRYDLSGDYPAADWAEPDHDDSGWYSGTAPFFAGGDDEDVAATAWATADNYFALYLGQADGSDLRLVGEDSDGSWTTVEEIDLDLTAQDHLYLAAWELTGDSTSPQMLIAEVELPDDTLGTDASAFEWVLGPTDASPGALPTNAPPTEAALTALIEDATATGSWELPSVEDSRSASPWGATVSSAFTSAAMFIWGDTFDSDSVTNSEDTYALFRSIAPVVTPRGNMELSEIPTTITFRTDFTFTGSLSATTLHLDCTLDDGAVFTLNGVEVLRENMPAGTVDATTLATAEVTDATDFSADIPAAALVGGLNVLAVEVHQATSADLDMTFGCTLTAESWIDAAEPTIVLNEVAPASASPMWVELRNVSPGTQDIDGLLLTSSAGDEAVLSAGSLEPGELLALDDLGFSVEAGDRLFLYTADGSTLLDGVAVGEGLRGRADAGGPWRTPSEATPGEANQIERSQDVVINEIQYHRAPLSEEGTPVTERSEEWIELYNRGEEAVDLSGWQLVDAVAYALPEGTTLAPGDYLIVARDAKTMQADYPKATVIGEFSGSLSNSGDRILLLDALGNPADEVRYFDGGRWPSAADGGGASLELRDPWADNNTAEAWTASDESHRSAWIWTTIRGVAESSPIGPDGVWEELVLGLLDEGEVLIDDLSVVQDPDTAPVELLQSGSFDDIASWRLLGSHRHSEVVPDPDDSSNSVLRLVSTGPIGHMHNHAETTLLQPISDREYEITFRARWISGSNQLHSRLYFNRLPRTTLVEQPAESGTPGEENSAIVENLGPTFGDLSQDVAVPAPEEPVLISISIDDPDGVDSVTLFSAVDGAAFQGTSMVEDEPGRWSAERSGEAGGAIVQLYVEATDTLGAAATFPAAGADSRALYTVDDGLAETNGLHNLRILMTTADADWLHEDVNLMSDDLVGATVVYEETEVFYDVGVRLKGSERGRPTEVRLGYGIRFHDEQPFRGSHTSVLIDRSEGVNFGQREVLMNLMMTRGGSVSGEYNDLIQLLAPRSAYTGAAELQLDRFSNLMLASQFADGSSGTRVEYELIYYPTTTDDGTPEGLKLPQPDSVSGTSITDLGDDREDYRWNYLIKSSLREDNYDPIIDLCQTFSLSDEAFLKQSDAVIDVEQWLRAFAFATLSGATDQYGGAGSQHNAQFYVRPEDGRVLYFPHDLDYFSSASMSVVANGDLSRLLEDPINLRSYYGHLNDIIGLSYNTDYLAPWCEQLAELLPGQDFESHCQFIGERADWVLSSSSESVLARFPAVDFHITTGGGEDLNVSALEVTLEGEAWVDVREIVLEGEAGPLALTWVDEQTWQVTVPLEAGDNDLTLVATDLSGAIVGSDAILVTSSDGG